MVDPNTRQGKRTPVTLKIKFKSETIEQFIERYAVDVSQGGIFIRTKEPLSVGTQMRFEFQLRDASPLIAGEGTVVWTRENDPSRPAIAPGMGVRFDRLAEGSQTVLERILSEKAKQAPQRKDVETPTKPPLFTDTPTRVAPAPVQDALLGAPRTRSSEYNDSNTPLPKPMPFHSDADDFDEQAFEEATKVRALDELIAQTADDGTDELAARRGQSVRDALAEPAGGAVKAPAPDRDSAPGLPSPPAPNVQTPRGSPRLLDTSPSPRTEPMAKAAGPGASADHIKTRMGVEPARQPHASQPPATSIRDQPTRPSGMRAVAAEPTLPTRGAAQAKKSSTMPLVLLLLLVLSAAGAAVWFFVVREKVADDVAQRAEPGSGSAPAVALPTPTGSGSDSAPTPGSGSETQQGSDAVAPPPPTGDLVATVIGSNIEASTVEIIGADGKVVDSGPAPFTARLEKDKPYKARVISAGFATSELELKGGGPKQVAKLMPKPRVLDIATDPPGALIYVDGMAIGGSTPRQVQLSKSQAAKKSVKVRVTKAGFKAIERVITTEAYTEDSSQLIAKLDERLSVQVQISRPPDRTGSASTTTGSAGTTTGSAGTTAGSAGTTTGSAGTTTGSAGTTTGSAGTTTGSAGTTTGSAGTSTGSGSAGAGSATKPPAATGSGSATTSSSKGTGEPEPEFVKSK